MYHEVRVWSVDLVLVVHPSNGHESGKAELVTVLPNVLHQLQATITRNTMFI